MKTGNSGHTMPNINQRMRVRLSSLCALGALGAGFLLAGAATAAEPEQSFTVQGFGTAGLARTNTDDVEFVRDLSQPRGIGKDWSSKIDSVLGIQANWRIAPQLEAVVQATSRYRHDRSYDPEIEWAYLKFDPTPALSLRAGRLGTEFFMLADSRWVGYSFLTVRPVGDYFWYLPFYTIHGADAALSARVGEGVLRGKLFYGLSDGKVPLGDAQWNIDGSPMAGGYLEFHHGPWQLRGSYSNIRFKHDLPVKQVFGLPESADLSHLAAEGKQAHYYSLGLVYDNGPWQAQLMLNHIEQRSLALQSSDGGYSLLGYRIASVTPYAGYSWVRSRSRNVPLTGDPVMDRVTRVAMADSHSDQQTYFLGMRWDFAPNMAAKAQWDGIRGKPSSIFPYRKDGAAWDGTMDVFSLTLDFVF